MPNFTFNTAIPATNNNPSVDQGGMLTNNVSTNAIINVDHYTFNNNNGGLHKQVTLPVEATPTTVSGQAALYSNTAGQSQLFATTDVAGNAYQLSRFIDASFTNFGTNNAYGSPPATFTQVGGWTFLPGGLLLQYGQFSKAGALGASGTIQFPINFTNPPFVINAILIRSSSASQFMSLPAAASSNSSFSFQASSGSSDGVYWIAIGV